MHQTLIKDKPDSKSKDEGKAFISYASCFLLFKLIRELLCQLCPTIYVSIQQIPAG